MNTLFLEKEFDYFKPEMLNEALDILAEKKDVRIFAGGTDLIVKMKIGDSYKIENMLDINGIAELQKIDVSPDNMVIGATNKISVLEKNADIARLFPALQEAFLSMASISLRNMATMIGNICNASPGADTAGPLLCYGASVKIVSKGKERMVPMEDFFVEGGKTILQPDELVTEVHIPTPKKNTGASFIKISRIKADLAKLSVTIVLEREGSKVSACRMSIASVAGLPLYMKEIGDDLVGKEMTEALVLETADKISKFIRPRDGGNRTTAAYRRDVSKIISRDAMKLAWERSGGKF